MAKRHYAKTSKLNRWVYFEIHNGVGGWTEFFDKRSLYLSKSKLEDAVRPWKDQHIITIVTELI